MQLLDHPLLIVGFIIAIIGMLLLDLGVFNKTSHEVSNKEALIWSAVWISLSMAFSGVIYWVFSADSHAIAIEKFSQFQSAYWIEKALSVDNLFVFILVFSYFNVSKDSQHKVLFWGIIGALVMRAIFIFSGVGLIELTYLPEMELFGTLIKINVVMTLFGLFLVYAGIKSAVEALSGGDDDEEKDFSKSPGAKFIHYLFKGKVSDTYDGDKFFTYKTVGNKVVKYATPLLVVVGVIEFTDLLFAVDSIPAIFAIAPNDPFILYTSNIFAILGLRSLYFLLANFIHMFKYLPYGLAVILSFIGIKMLIAPVYHIESTHSLIFVGSILLLLLYIVSIELGSISNLA
jgi:tellurite resistance protein TerC